MKALKFSHLLLGLLVTFLWGLNFTVIKVGLNGIPPIFLCFLRFFFSAFPAIFFLPRPEVPFSKVAAYGFVIFVCQFTFLFAGMHYGLSAGLASIVLQMQVFVTIALSMVILHEWPLKSQLAGAAIAFAGIILIGACAGSEISMPGLGLTLLAALCWGYGNMIARSIGTVNIFSLVVWASLIATLPLGLLSLAVEGKTAIFSAVTHITWLSAGAVFYLAYLSTVFGYAVWSSLITRYPAATAAPITLYVPVFGLACAAILLGEPLPFWKIGAVLLILFGLAINLCGPRLSRQQKVQQPPVSAA